MWYIAGRTEANSLAVGPRKTRVIALMNQKGGVGKTTTTVNLGAALARAGAKVLLIDLDPQGHCSLHVGVDASQIEHSVYDLLMDDALAAETVIRSTESQVDVIPAVVDLAAAEQELANEPDKQLRLKRKLKPVVDRYDYVLLDCPPSLGLLTLNGLAAASEVIVPMQAHFLALQGLSKLLETIQLVRISMNTTLKVSGVVLAMHESHTNLAMEVVADLERFFESSRKLSMPWSHASVYQPPIRRNIKLAECPSFGQTIFQYEPTCPGAADYEALAQSVSGTKVAVAAVAAVPAVAAPTPIASPVPTPVPVVAEKEKTKSAKPQAVEETKKKAAAPSPTAKVPATVVKEDAKVPKPQASPKAVKPAAKPVAAKPVAKPAAAEVKKETKVAKAPAVTEIKKPAAAPVTEKPAAVPVVKPAPKPAVAEVKEKAKSAKPQAAETKKPTVKSSVKSHAEVPAIVTAPVAPAPVPATVPVVAAAVQTVAAAAHSSEFDGLD